mgnify:CR=1 FL=1
MFSLDRFYNILHTNLLGQFPSGRCINFYPFGTYESIQVQTSIRAVFRPDMAFAKKTYFDCYFFDQEPFYQETQLILEKVLQPESRFIRPNNVQILAVSEHSDIVNIKNFYTWYYFFHGFAALDWYRDFQYFEPHVFNKFDKVFICYNHLISNLRSYRLHLGSNIISQNLAKHGRFSLFLKDYHGTWKQSVTDPDNPLTSQARKKIYQVLKDVHEPFIIDTSSPKGALSATINFQDSVNSFFHVVTETVYFSPKLHLTEKIFKPIVCKRPFILVAAPGNLNYLKSYGFQTFDRWIDESYDQETDHYARIEKITAEIARLCAMSPSKLHQIHREMQDTLEYNFDHFYSNFRYKIIDELVDNFDLILQKINYGKISNNHSRYHVRYELSQDYLNQVRQRLKQ